MVHIEEYLSLVESEKLHKMCKEQKQLVKMIRKILDEEQDKIYIDEKRVETYLSYQKYFEFKLFEWEKFLLVLMLCTFYKESGLPRFNTLFCLVGRGSGKNAFLAFLSFCLTTETNGVKNYNIDIVANSEEQAKTSFMDIYNVLNDPLQKEKMKKHFKWNKCEITNKKTMSTIRYKTSNAKSQDGLRPGCVIYDEVHQYENWKLIDVARTGLGKIEHPRQFFITTDGHVRDAVLDELKEKGMEILQGALDDSGFLPFICKLDSEEEVHNPECWFKANPSLVYRPSLLKQIENEYVDYKLSPFTNISFLVKRMNIPKNNESAPITDYENIKATNQPIPYSELNGLYCTVGIDFSTISDMVGVAICIKKNKKYYLITHAWMNKNSKDLPKIKAPLETWGDMGLLTFTDGVENNPHDVFKWIVDTTEKYGLIIDGIAIDLYRLSVMKKAMETFNFDFDDKDEVKLVRPSDIMLTVPVIDSLFNRNAIVVGDSPLVRWSMNNTQLVPKQNGNFVYDKIDAFRRKNDVFMAIVHAIVISDRLTDYDDMENFFPW